MRSIWCTTFVAAALICILTMPAGAFEDVSPRVQLGRIATYGYDDAGDSSANPVYLTAKPLRVFPYVFGDFADTIGDPYFDNFPGIHALSSANTQGYIPSGLPTGSIVSFDVLSDLKFWGGADPVAFNAVPAGETLALSLFTNSITIGTGSGFYPGFNIQSVDALGGMHRHLNAELQAGTNPIPADGIYLFEMRLKLSQSDGTPYPGINPSLPFFLMYENNANNDLPISAYQEAQDWVKTNLVPFGDFNRDHTVDAADIPAMLSALTDLKAYKATNQLTDFDLLAFGDIDSDGKLTNADVESFLNLLSSGAAMQLVPEPPCIVIAAVGAFVCLASCYCLGRRTIVKGQQPEN
jgi:hypothetical protein